MRDNILVILLEMIKNKIYDNKDFQNQIVVYIHLDLNLIPLLLAKL